MIDAGEHAIRLQRIRSLEIERIGMGRQIGSLMAEVIGLDLARVGWMTAALALDQRLEQARADRRRLEQAWRAEIDKLAAECVRLKAEIEHAKSGGLR